jgi:SAM-dependent methyltransferase
VTALFHRFAARPIDVPNSSRVHLERWVRERAAQVPPGGLVLDAGAGEAPYRSLFAGLTYESADFLQVDKPYAPPTYECDLTAIPVDDDRYDLVLCSQVLEHVPDPLAVLRELARVTKPTGRVAVSAPLFYEEHEEPFDFFRYTKHGFRHLADAAGLDVESIVPLEGYFGTLSYQLTMASRPGVLARTADGSEGWNRRARLVGAEVLRFGFGRLARWFARLDTASPVTDVGMCKNYACVLLPR